jgi:VIT family
VSRTHSERHLIARIGWLRAAVLGANDGLLSTSSLIVGVAASGAPKTAVLVTGVAGLVAGAMSMAAGEYVSVSSQSDTEKPTWPGKPPNFPPRLRLNGMNWRRSMSSGAFSPKRRGLSLSS